MTKYKAGGYVDVTLKDGTKVLGAPLVKQSDGTVKVQIASVRYLLPGCNKWAMFVTSVDAYTPPEPEWAAPNVRAIIDRNGAIYVRVGTDRWRKQSVEGRYLSTDQLQKIDSAYLFQVWAVAPE